MKKTIICFIIMSIFLLNLVNALELNPFAEKLSVEKVISEDMTDFLKEDFNEKYGVIKLSETFLWIETDKIAEYSLTKNTEQCLINCEAEGKAILYKKGKLFEDFNFINRLGLEKNIDYKIYIKEIEYYNESYPETYKTICEEIKVNTTEKTLEDITTEKCYDVIETYKIETKNKTIWKEYNFEELPEGNYNWKLKAKKTILESIDFIPLAQGKELNEWAWWDASWNKKEEIKIQENSGLDEEDYAVNITLFYDADMNANFSDIRFINSAENTELNFWIESLDAGDHLTAWVEIPTLTANVNTSIYAYYGNPSANYANTTKNNVFVFDESYFSGWTIYEGTMNQGENLDGTSGDYDKAYKNFTKSHKINGYKLTYNYYVDDTDIVYTMIGTPDKTAGTHTGNVEAMWKGIAHKEDSEKASTTWTVLSNITTYSEGVIGRVTTGANVFASDATNGNENAWNKAVYYRNSTKGYLKSSNGGAITTLTQVQGGFSSVALFGSYYDKIEVLFRFNGEKLDNITLMKWSESLPTYEIQDEETAIGLNVNYLTPPTLEDGVDWNKTYIPVKVNITYRNVTFSNITYRAYKGDVLNQTLFYTSGIDYINFTTCLCDTWKYNVTVCGISDLDGSTICDSTPTRTVYVDIIPPEINITSPSGIVDYLYSNKTLHLNWTVLDTHLDSCWYIYDSVLTPVTCSLNHTTFNYKKNINSLIFYANDTFGNFNSRSINWGYVIFENSNNFNSNTLSGGLESYSLNFSLNESYEINSADFIYNNTEESSSISIFDTDVLINVTNYFVPSVDVITNFSFYYSMLVGSSIINSTINNQTVSPILFDNCSNYTYKLVNLSLYDEQFKTALYGDIEVNYNLLNVPLYNTINSFSILFENVTNAEICSDTNLTSVNVLQSLEIRYKGGGTNLSYVPELYHVQRAEINPEPLSIKLFDLNTSSSTEFKVTYQDSTFTFVKDAIIQLQRKYISEGIFETVEAPLTSSEGVAIVHVDLNTIKYMATVVKNGVVLDIFDNVVFDCESELTGDCEQKLLGEIDPDNDINQETLIDFAYTEPVLYNGSISTSFSIPSGSSAPVTISITQRDSFGNITLANRTITSTAGSLSVDYTDTLGQSFIDFKIYKDGEPVASKSYIVAKETGLNWLGNNYIFIVIIILSLVGMALSSPEWIVINGVVTMVISGGLYLANGLDFVTGLGGLVWLVIAVIILIYKMSKQEDR